MNIQEKSVKKKKATKTANHEMKSSCPTALSSYADNLLFLTKDIKREKINFDKFDKELKNNCDNLFSHINQMLETITLLMRYLIDTPSRITLQVSSMLLE